MIETALCVTFILLPLTVGVVQYGVILSTMHQLDQLSREGARYAAVHAGESNFDSAENVAGSLKAYLKTISDGKTVVLWDDIKNNITVTPAKNATPPRTSGQPVTVTISYFMKKKMFMASFPGMGGLAQTYNSRSTFVLE